MPFLGRQIPNALAWTCPATHRLPCIVKTYQRPRPRTVISTLAVPSGDESIHRYVAYRKKDLHILVDVMLVTARHILRKAQPMPRLARRLRSVAHELDDRLLHRSKGGV